MQPLVARIDYLNTEPFFHAWDEKRFPLMRGAPRALAHAAREGSILAGPLPIVANWELEESFSPLGAYGIAAGQSVGSVFLVSHAPLATLNNVTIGVTEETSTSVVLCATLIAKKYGHKVRFLRGQRSDDEGFIVIGDAALRLAHDPFHSGWPFVTDLAAEWWQWQRLPFVFARWVARNDTPAAEKKALEDHLETNLTAALANLKALSPRAADRVGLDATAAFVYLSGIRYRLGGAEEESIRRFRELASSAVSMLGGIRPEQRRKVETVWATRTLN